MKTPRIRLCWKSYFKAFCQEHGEPIRWGKRLLFPDGWSYHALDHKGPEWAPPADAKLLALFLRKYWELRLALIQSQRKVIESDLRAIDEMQAARPIRLQERKAYMDEQGDKVVTRYESQPVDLTLMTERLVWLAQEADKCVAKLRELQHEPQRQA